MSLVDEALKLFIPYTTQLIGSVALLIAARFARDAALVTLAGRGWSSEDAKLRWTARLRSITVLVIIIGFVAIWSPQLQALAFSVVAFAAALVVAMKELIMCLTGGMVRMFSESFTVGDRVEIGSARGDVIRLGVFTTTILEIGPGHQRTGRALVIPNSALLNQNITNESFTQAFVLHVITVPMKRAEGWEAHAELLVQIAQSVCEPYLDDARKHLNRVADQHGLSISVIEPRVIVQLPDPEKVNLLLRVAVPSSEKGRHEQAILQEYLSALPLLPPPDATSSPETPAAPTDEEPSREVA